MPYSYSYRFLKIPRNLDRRVKLSDENREKLLNLKNKLSQRKAAKMFNVSRSLVRFIWMPEKLEHAKELLKQRRKDKRYYPGAKEWSKILKEHRRYKQSIKQYLVSTK